MLPLQRHRPFLVYASDSEVEENMGIQEIVIAAVTAVATAAATLITGFFTFFRAGQSHKTTREIEERKAICVFSKSGKRYGRRSLFDSRPTGISPETSLFAPVAGPAQLAALFSISSIAVRNQSLRLAALRALKDIGQGLKDGKVGEEAHLLLNRLIAFFSLNPKGGERKWIEFFTSQDSSSAN